MFKCCTLNFDDLKVYLKHLEFKSNKSNTKIQVKCNICGNNSKTWVRFKRHYKTYHKESKITESLFAEEISSAADFEETYFNLPNDDCFESNNADFSILLEEDEIQTDPIIETILNQSKVI